MAQKFNANATLLLVTASFMLFFSLIAGQQRNKVTAGSSHITVNGDNAKVYVDVNSKNYISNYNSDYDVYYNYDDHSIADSALAGAKVNRGGGGNQTAPLRRYCPMERVMKVGAECVDGLVIMSHNRIGLREGRAHGPGVIDPVMVKQCCPVLGELQMDFNTTSVCLCATLKVKALNLKTYVPLVRSLLTSCRASTTTTTTTTTAQAQLLPIPAPTTTPPPEPEFTCSLVV